MRKLLSLPLLALSASAAAQFNQLNEWSQRQNLFDDIHRSQLPAGTFRYRRGTVSLTVPDSQQRAPLIVWLAGVDLGSDTLTYSTEQLPDFFYEEGYALATIESARADRFDAEAVARNNAAAIASLVRQVNSARVDTGRIILMGTGASGHAAALLATDSHYLEEAGLSFAAVRGVLLIDGEGFDVPGSVANAEERHRRQYERVFGAEPERQSRLSPASYLASPNSPAFMFFATEGVSNFAAQARAMADALQTAGSRAEVRVIPPTTPHVPETYLGFPQDPETERLISDLRWLAGLEPR